MRPLLQCRDLPPGGGGADVLRPLRLPRLHVVRGPSFRYYKYTSTLIYLHRCVVGYCGHEEYFAAIGDIECEAGQHGAAVCQVGRYVDIYIYVSKYLHRTCCWGTSAAMTSAAPHWAEYRGDAAVTKQGSYRPARTWGTRS